jgi:hypothetical protein
MKISRRTFVKTAAGTIAGCYLPQASGRAAPERGRSVLLDLEAGCVLGESLEGYRQALGGEALRSWKSGKVSGWNARTVVVAGTGNMDPGTTPMLLELLHRGTNVLFESAAGFLSADEFVAQQKTLRDGFGVMVDWPVNLWSQDRMTPYVNYTWPRSAMIRDFSRVVPVAAGEPEIIARAGCLPLASRRRVGKGLFIFVGSPLGPALRAGDAAGQEWLGALTSGGAGRSSI